jgi:hypothetical protein
MRSHEQLSPVTRTGHAKFELQVRGRSVCDDDALDVCDDGARWHQTVHDSPCTAAAKHRETLRANGIEQKLNKSVMSPPTNLPQQIPDVPAGYYPRMR